MFRPNPGSSSVFQQHVYDFNLKFLGTLSTTANAEHKSGTLCISHHPCHLITPLHTKQSSLSLNHSSAYKAVLV